MFKKPYSFIIYGQPATKKNSSIMVSGRNLILPSKSYREYAKVFRQQLCYLRDKQHFDTGVNLAVRYYLRDKAHFPDLVGLMQATADLLADEYKTFHGKKTLINKWVLSDDRIIKSWNGTKIAGIDKQNPRTEIEIQPLGIDISEEIDPYIIRTLKQRQEQSLF